MIGFPIKRPYMIILFDNIFGVSYFFIDKLIWTIIKKFGTEFIAHKPKHSKIILSGYDCIWGLRKYIVPHVREILDNTMRNTLPIFN